MVGTGGCKATAKNADAMMKRSTSASLQASCAVWFRLFSQLHVVTRRVVVTDGSVQQCHWTVLAQEHQQ